MYTSCWLAMHVEIFAIAILILGFYQHNIGVSQSCISITWFSCWLLSKDNSRGCLIESKSVCFDHLLQARDIKSCIGKATCSTIL